MFKYAEIEAALAKVHDIPPGAMKTFRSRIRNFQKIGLVPSSPGKGQKVSYTIEYVIYWAICFELVEVGLSPAAIMTLTKWEGSSLISFFEGPISTTAHFLVLGGDFLNWHLTDDEQGKKLGSYRMGILPKSKLEKEVLNNADMPRVILINMTTLKKKLGQALNIDWSTYKRNWDPEASPVAPRAGDFAG